MPSKPLLIAGIDPGTTSAYALIDMSGRFVSSRSAKELALSQLLSEIHSQGKVIAVGTDKAKVPGLVHEFAAKVGARIFSPREDLRVLEKKEITKNFPVSDVHEMDALASAFFAFHQLAPLLSKIEKFCEEYDKQGIKNQIIERVIKEGVSIRDAAKSIEMPIMEKVVIHEPKITQMVGEKTIAKREAQLIDLEKQVKILRRHSHILKKELRSKEKPTVIVKKDISKDLLQKDQIIQHLRRTITKKEGEKQILQRKAQLLEHFLMRAKDHYVLKKLENFGMEEFTKKKFLSIQRDDILLVDDPNTMSMAVIDELRKIVSVIIHKKPVSERVRSMLPFIFIDAAKLQIKEAGSLAIVPKRQMDEHRSARSALKKVIEEYHKERNLLNSP